MPRVLNFLGGAALLLFLASAAEAQERALAFGVSGGVSFPLGEIGDEFDPGYHLTGLLELTPGGLPFALRGEGVFQRFSHEDDYLRHLAGRLNAVIPFAVAPDARPYLIVGAGVYNSKEVVDHGDHTHDDAETFLGVNVGVGIHWAIGRLNTFVESRFHNVFDDVHAQRFIPLTIGIRF